MIFTMPLRRSLKMPTDISNLASTVGLCAKARAIVCGTPLICEALRRSKPPVLVLLAKDAAPNAVKKLTDKCSFYGVELKKIPLDTAELAAAVGKQGLLAAVAITNEGLAKAVCAKL